MVNKEYVVISGIDTSRSAKLNASICQPFSAMDTADNTTVSLVADAAYTTKRTLAIGANQITNYIIIRGNFRCVANPPGSNSTTTVNGKLQLTIDSTQKLELTDQATNTYYATGGGDADNARGKSFCFKYTPSAGEKASGFTIDLDLYMSSDANGGSVNNDYWEVWGA